MSRVVMLLYLTLDHRRRLEAGELRDAADLREAIVEGAAHRIRPKLMTVLCLLLGLAPILWSDSAGADVMKRIVAPMVGADNLLLSGVDGVPRYLRRLEGPDPGPERCGVRLLFTLLACTPKPGEPAPDIDSDAVEDAADTATAADTSSDTAIIQRACRKLACAVE